MCVHTWPPFRWELGHDDVVSVSSQLRHLRRARWAANRGGFDTALIAPISPCRGIAAVNSARCGACAVRGAAAARAGPGPLRRRRRRRRRTRRADGAGALAAWAAGDGHDASAGPPPPVWTPPLPPPPPDRSASAAGARAVASSPFRSQSGVAVDHARQGDHLAGCEQRHYAASTTSSSARARLRQARERRHRQMGDDTHGFLEGGPPSTTRREA